MGFIILAQGVIFDITNGDGWLLHTGNGECLALDHIATMMVQAGLEHTTREEVIENLQAGIDASAQQLEDGLHRVMQQLRSYHLLSSEPQVVSWRPMQAKTQQQKDTISSFHTPWFSSQQQYISTTPDWEVFLTGKMVNEPLPRFPWFKRLRALSNATGILFVLGGYRLIARCWSWLRLHEQGQHVQQHEWKSICRILSALSMDSSSSGTERECEVLERLGHRELVWCQFVVRMVAPKALCLVRSVALCTYLRTADLPAQLVVGRERFCLSEDGDFHAWVELAGRVINDHDEVQTGYALMHRIP